jgi:hypothetical protein
MTGPSSHFYPSTEAAVSVSGPKLNRAQVFLVAAMGGRADRALGTLAARKRRLADLLPRRPDGIFVAPLEPGAIGPGLFEAACRMRLEGLVSKHRERWYRRRTCDWVEVKNRAHPAFKRVSDQFG